jgi:fibronectin-binding autotransporter adhesin
MPIKLRVIRTAATGLLLALIFLIPGMAVQAAGPYSCSWTGGGGADTKWSTTTNWSCTDAGTAAPGVFPGKGDSAIIDNPGIVTLSNSFSGSNSLASLRIIQGTLQGDSTNATTLAATTLEWSGGSLVNSPATHSVTLTSSNFSLVSSSNVVFSTSNFSLVVPQSDSGAAWNPSTHALSLVTSGTILTLASGGSIHDALFIIGNGMLNWSGGILTNVAAAGDLTPSFANLAWMNGNTAIFTSPGVLLTLPHSGTATWTGTTTTLALSTGSVLALPSGGHTDGNFNVAGSGSLDWRGGDLTGATNNTLTATNLVISGPSSRALDTLDLTASGLTDWTESSTLYLNSGAALTCSGGLTAVHAGPALITSTTAATKGAFSFGGTLTKQGAGTLQDDLALNNNTTGMSISIESGTLSLAGGGSSSRSVIISTVGVLQINGSSYSLSSSLGTAGLVDVHAGTLTTSSTGTFSFPNLMLSGGALNGAVDIAVTGDLSWSAGTITVITGTPQLTSQTLTFSGSSQKTLVRRVMRVTGLTTWPAGVGALMMNGSSLALNGGGNIAGDISAQNNCGLTLDDASTAVTGTISLPLAIPATTMALVNTGTNSLSLSGSIEIIAGSTFQFNGGDFTVDGSFNNAGTTTIAAGTISFASGAALTNLGSSVALNGGVLDLSEALPTTPLEIADLSIAGGVWRGSHPVSVTHAMSWLNGSIQGSGGISAASLALKFSSSATIATFSGAVLTLPLSATTAAWNGASLALDSGAFLSFSSGGTLNADFGMSGSGELRWGGGDLTNGAASGAVTLGPVNLGLWSGTSVVFSSSAVTLAIPFGATTAWDGASLSLPASAVLFLSNGGAVASGLAITGDGTLNWSGGDLTGAGSINAAHLDYTGSASRSLGIPLTVTSALATSDSTQPGSLTLTGGSLLLNAGGTLSWAVSLADSNSRLKFGAGNSNLSATSSIEGSGEVEFAGGAGQTTNISGTYALTGTGRSIFTSGTIHFQKVSTITSLGSTVTLSGADLDLSGTLSTSPLAIPSLIVTAGTLQGANPIDVTTRLSWFGGSIQGSGGVTAALLDLKNSSAISQASFTGISLALPFAASNASWDGAGLDLSSDTVLTLLHGGGVGGALNVNGSGSLRWDGGNLIGAGTLTTQNFNYTGSAGRSLTNITLNLNGSLATSEGIPPGTLTLTSTNLNLNNGGALDWPFVISNGSALTFGGGSFILPATSELNGAGAVRFAAGSGSQVNVSGTVNLTGSTSFTSGEITFTAGAVLDNLGNPVLIDGATLAIDASVTTNLTGTIDIKSGSLVLRNGGTISQAVLVETAGTLVFGGGAFNLTGQLDVNSTGTFEVRAGAVSIKTTTGSPFTFPNLAISGGLLTASSGADDVLVSGSLIWSGGTIASPDQARLTVGSLSVAGTAPMILDTRRLIVNGISQSPAGSGTLTLLNASINFGGGGTLGGDMSVQGNCALSLAAGMTVSGNVNLESSAPAGNLQLTNSGPSPTTFSGALSVPALSALTFSAGDFAISGSFDNAGGSFFSGGTVIFTPAASLIRFGNPVTIAGGAVEIDSLLATNVNGLMDIQSGSLTLTGGGTINQNVLVEVGGVMIFNGGSFALNAAFDPASAGLVEIRGGTVNIETITGSPYSFPNLTVSGGVLTAASGRDNLQVSGSFTWSGGEIAGSPGSSLAVGVIAFSGTHIMTLNTRTLSGSGPSTWSSLSTLYLENSQYTNQAGAVLTVISSGSAIFSYLVTPGTGAFTNLGTLSIQLPPGQQTEIDVPLTNTGTLQVNSGVLKLNGVIESTSSGPIQVDLNGKLIFGFGTYTLLSGPKSSLSGDGSVEFATGTGLVSLNCSYTLNPVSSSTIITSGDVFFNPTSAAPVLGYQVAIGSLSSSTSALVHFSTGNLISIPNLTVAGGTLDGLDSIAVGILNWSGGAIVQPVGIPVENLTVQTAFNLLGPDSKTLTGRSMVISAPTTWTGSGTLAMDAGAALVNNAAMTVDIVNSDLTSVDSILIYSASDQETFTNNGSLMKLGIKRAMFRCPMFNGPAGSIAVQDGLLVLTYSFTMTGGTLDIATPATLSVISSDQSLTLTGGTIRGGGTISGNLINTAGTVAPGGAVLKITGSYTQTFAGTLEIDLLAHSALAVSSTVSFGGTIRILPNGVTPTVGSIYLAVSYFDRSGIFDIVTVSPPLTGLYLVPQYEDTGHSLNLICSDQLQMGFKIYIPSVHS